MGWQLVLCGHEVCAALAKKGFEKDGLEWMRCTLNDVKTVLAELLSGQKHTGTAHEKFPMRNLKSPETYFQAAFRVQLPWSVGLRVWCAKGDLEEVLGIKLLARRGDFAGGGTIGVTEDQDGEFFDFR